MLALYLFSLGLGGVLMAASFFGDADADDGVEEHAEWQHIFSLRNATYFLFVFGFIGSLMTWLTSAGGIMTALTAGLTGLAVAGLVHAVFGYIRRSDTSEVAPDTIMIGMGALVTLPIRTGAVGKVELTLDGKRVELLAKPFDMEKLQDAEIATGSEVLIVDIVAGTALVSRTTE